MHCLWADGGHPRFNRYVAERLAQNRWVEKWEIASDSQNVENHEIPTFTK